MYQSEEKDWKLFRKKLPKWQEAYMERLIEEYAELLNGDAAASEKFRALDKRIRADRQRLGVRVDDVSRSKLQNILTGLIIENIITEDDLQDFSEELRESTCQWMQIYRRNLEEYTKSRLGEKITPRLFIFRYFPSIMPNALNSRW